VDGTATACHFQPAAKRAFLVRNLALGAQAPWRDCSTHPMMSQAKFVQQLAVVEQYWC